MEKQPNLKLAQYDEKWNKTGEVEVSAYEIGQNITPEQLAEVLDNYINHFKDFRDGERIGKMLETTHPTLQASLFRWALGICVGLSDRKYTDGRNEMPVACGKKIDEFIKDGTLKMGWMI